MHYHSRKYTTLIEWIACNDGAGDEENTAQLADHLTVTMIAHCYNLRPLQVADDVMTIRTQYFNELEG